jgi:hypothetical protein
LHGAVFHCMALAWRRFFAAWRGDLVLVGASMFRPFIFTMPI